MVLIPKRKLPVSQVTQLQQEVLRESLLLIKQRTQTSDFASGVESFLIDQERLEACAGPTKSPMNKPQIQKVSASLDHTANKPEIMRLNKETRII